jgi:hypothetical protein
MREFVYREARAVSRSDPMPSPAPPARATREPEPGPDGTKALLERLRVERERLCGELAALDERIREVGTQICPRCAATGEYRVRSGLYPAFEVWPCDCRSEGRLPAKQVATNKEGRKADEGSGFRVQR